MFACLPRAETFNLILAIAAIGVLVVYVLIWWHTRKMAKASIEASNLQSIIAFFAVYEKIIVRYQKDFPLGFMGRVVEEMRSGVLLKRIDGTEPETESRTKEQAISNINIVSDYFDDIGEQLKSIWDVLPESLRVLIAKNLSGDVSSVWGFVDQHKGLIAPVRSIDWLSSLKWLYETFEKMKKEERKKYPTWARR